MISKNKTAGIGRRIGMASAGLLAIVGVTSGLPAQTVSDNSVPTVGLNIPENMQIFGKLDPNIRKATAIVNEAVITGTDVDQRINLIVAANQLKLNPEEHDRLRLQVLRSLIDETLQIQQAKTNEIVVTRDEIDQSFARVSQQFGKSEADMRAYLRSVGSSDRSLRRQIEADLAWNRYLRRRVEPFVNVGEEEVKGIIERLKAAQGSNEYHLKEIYLAAGPDRAQQVFDNMRQMIQDIEKGGKPFEYYTQFSDASTRSTQGDLDWVSTSQLTYLPPSLAEAAQKMGVGEVAGPIEVPGGFSILYLVDKRQVLMADARDAQLTLKQLTVRFPPGMTQASAGERVAQLEKVTHAMQGCGNVAKVAGELNAEVVDNASVKARDLPARLQEMVLKMQIGEATPWFGSPTEGVRTLVLCGRDDPQTAALPQADQVQSRIEQQRVNLRAQGVLRDLRRDAVIEYR
ncbi:MAG: SurA N-terminal domain-containing protein [Pseudomonadota bacterium]|jgi:peptidyl-prolyl cis-trans isomerase SurA|uniref:Survival protein SurA (Peptidyl-prolyl cis-trans isomerase SurA) n=1 Tax=hydrothermal vent metagenome TaxID=652676 RepID=A0A161K0U8_9ZZZZ